MTAGHDFLVDLLLRHGASLATSMDPMDAAGQLCTAVFKGDLPRLKRLLRAGADANGAHLKLQQLAPVNVVVVTW